MRCSEQFHRMHRNVIPTKKTGSEPFHVQGHPAPFTLLDFWATAFSDQLTSMNRGILAEYLMLNPDKLTCSAPLAFISKSPP